MAKKDFGPERFVEVDGHSVKLTQLEKVWYPQTGTTKGEVLAYYAKIAPLMLAHLQGRPATLKRYPHGAEGESFFEKNAPPGKPEWVETFARWSESRGRETNYVVLNDLASLMWAINLSSIELHVPLSRVDDIDRPDLIAFDLDPGEGMSIVECCVVGKLVHGRLLKAGLRSFAKTSGSKGLQVYAPVTGVTYDDTKAFAHDLALSLERSHPELVVSNMRKAQRRGRILVDWSQNTSKKTTVAVYSVRARPEPTVSTPVTWREVEQTARGGDASSLRFHIDEVLERVARKGDLFGPVLKLAQGLTIPRV